MRVRCPRHGRDEQGQRLAENWSRQELAYLTNGETVAIVSRQPPRASLSSPAMAHPNPIVAALDQAGYRLTGPRRAVADLIAEHDGHFTASELEAHARDRRIDISRATLFRSLDLLTELQVVERLDLPTGEHAYVPCARAHHHHVICSRCGRTTEAEDCGVAEAVAEIARRSGYRIDSHRLELFGLCRHCQAKTTPDA
jgi:Fe2+ or Zn2+ uptake regulation protein